MADLMRVGAIIVNFDYIKNVFDDPEDPQTLIVMLSEPTVAPGHQQNFSHLAFTGEEAAALRWWFSNFTQDIVSMHKGFLGDQARPKRKLVGIGIDLMKEARASTELDKGRGQTQWDEGDRE